MIKTAVLVSGGGTNLQAILDGIQGGSVQNCQVVLVVSSKAGAYALERAKVAGIETAVCSGKDVDSHHYDIELISLLRKHDVELVVLAGFMRILGPTFIAAYRDAILNVHPSLIPSFCGKGFYGLRVHKAVLEAGVKLTGATVHFVNEIPDGGRILLQKAVKVYPSDTPEKLQQRVMKQAEYKLLPQAVSEFCMGKYKNI